MKRFRFLKIDRLLLALGITLVAAPARAQDWSMTEGRLREATRVVVLSDGNLAVAGTDADGASILTGLTPGGDRLWEVPVLDSSGAALTVTDLEAADDGGAIAVTQQGIVAAFAADGETMWSRAIAVEVPDNRVRLRLLAISRLDGGDYVVVGHDNVAYHYAGHVVRLSPEGRTMWSEDVVAGAFDGTLLGDVAVLGDGRIIAQGTTSEIVQGEPGYPKSPFVAAVGAGGGPAPLVSLQDTLIHDYLDWLFLPSVSIAPIGSTSFVIIGFNRNLTFEEPAVRSMPAYLGRFEASGEREWSTLLKFESADEDTVRVRTRGHAVAVSPSGQILITGDVTIGAGGAASSINGFIARFSANGVLQDEQMFGSPDESVQFLDVAVVDDGVVVAGIRDSMWHVASIRFPTGISRETPESVDDFRIEPNYPEPFGSTTTLPVHVASAIPVQVEVFDLIGRRIYRRISFAEHSGRREIQLHLDLPPGTYLCRVTAGGIVAMEPLVVVR